MCLWDASCFVSARMRGCTCSFVVWLQCPGLCLLAPRCTLAVASCTAGWGMCVTSWPLSWATEAWKPKPTMQVLQSASLTELCHLGWGYLEKSFLGMLCTLCDAHTSGLWGKCRPFTTMAFPCLQSCWFCWIFHGLKVTTAFILGGELDFFFGIKAADADSCLFPGQFKHWEERSMYISQF